MEIRVLGPVELYAHGHRVQIGRRQQRFVLAVLALEVNRLVSTDQLIELTWPTRAPRTAVHAIQVVVSGLRAALARAQEGDDGIEIASRGAGYLLQADPSVIDASRFLSLLDRARATNVGDRRIALLNEALDLWSGPALSGVTQPDMRERLCHSLEQARLTVHRDLIEMRLGMGEHEQLIAQLERLTQQHPFDEQLHRQLMVALYRAGRQVDALAAYQRLRHTLDEDLGIQPSPALRELEVSILRQDDSLAPQVCATAAGPIPAQLRQAAELDHNELAPAHGQHAALLPDLVAQAAADPFDEQLAGQRLLGATPAEQGALATARDRVEEQRRRTSPAEPHAAGSPVPRQLPADVSSFIGRVEELDVLHAQLHDRKAMLICIVSGSPGVGKTTLAVHWAHCVAGWFPDGQLYVNLRGFDPGRAPIAPAEAIRGFLDAFQVPLRQIPATLESQAALYRSLVAEKQLLVVLDNARDAEQVRPLLPGAPGCFVIVTSRNRLGGLIAGAGAWPVTLDTLSAAEARALLASRLGAARIDAEPAAVDEIITGCAQLPLALTVVAARIAGYAGLRLSVAAQRLRRARGGLEAFGHDDPATDIRAVFSWSHQALSTPAADLFRLLGLHPGVFTISAVASIGGLPIAKTRQLLDELLDTHLLTEPRPDRFTMHDLLRYYALDQANTHGAQSQREQAIRRMLDHYLNSAHGAALLLDPVRDPIGLPLRAVQPHVIVEHFDQREAALEWFMAEHRALVTAIELAAAAGWDRTAWQLAWTLADFLQLQGHSQDWADTQTAALGAACRMGDRPNQARAHRVLGRAFIRLGQPANAYDHFQKALALFEQLGEYAGQAHTLLNIAAMSNDQGRFQDALRYCGQALDLYRKANHRDGEANALNGLGWYHAQLGDHNEALGYCHQALAILQDVGDVQGQAVTWDSIGYAHNHLGQHVEAITCYRRAIDLYQDASDRLGQSDALRNLVVLC